MYIINIIVNYIKRGWHRKNKTMKDAVIILSGGRIALEPHVNDADTSHERWKLDPLDGNVRPENPTVWSIMEFTE